MERTRIAELLRPFLPDIGDSLLSQISVYRDLLLKWNARTNLTSIRNPEEIITRHFGESLFAAAHLLGSSVDHAIDVGSGAGFPGMVLKLYRPDIRVTLIESHSKKATFLKEVARVLALTDAEVFNDRAENYRAKGELVTLRAVEKFERVLLVAASLLDRGGRLGLLMGSDQIRGAQNVLPWLVWDSPVAIPGSRSRVLMVGEKE